MKIIAVIYATFAVAKKAWKEYSGLYGIRTLDLCDTGVALYQLSWQANWDDLHSNNSSLRSSHMCFSYVHNFIIIFSRVYNEPIQRSAPTWLFTLIGRVLAGIAEVKGSNPVQAWIFLQAFFATAKVAYITAMIFIHIILHSAVHIYVIHIFITLSRVFFLKRKLPFAKKTVFHRVNTSQLLFEFSN